MFKLKHVYSRVSGDCGSSSYGGYGRPKQKPKPTVSNEELNIKIIELEAKLARQIENSNMEIAKSQAEMLQAQSKKPLKQSIKDLIRIGCFVKKF